MEYDELHKMLRKQQQINPMEGYYSDDLLNEDLQITPDGIGEFDNYRQCMNFEIAGKGFEPIDINMLQNSYVKTKIKGQTIEEKNINNDQDLIEYIRQTYKLEL